MGSSRSRKSGESKRRIVFRNNFTKLEIIFTEKFYVPRANSTYTLFSPVKFSAFISKVLINT
jgi:hypothetical protein